MDEKKIRTIYDSPTEEESRAWWNYQNKQTAMSGIRQLNDIVPDGRFIYWSHYDKVMYIVHEWNNDEQLWDLEDSQKRPPKSIEDNLGMVGVAHSVLYMIHPIEPMVYKSDKDFVMDTLDMWRNALDNEVNRRKLAKAAKKGRLAKMWRELTGG